MTLPSRTAQRSWTEPAGGRLRRLAAYVPAVRFGDLVYTAGQLPLVDGTLRAAGKVGAEVSVDDAVRLCPDRRAQWPRRP